MKKAIILLSAIILSASLCTGCEGRSLVPPEEQSRVEMPQVPTKELIEIDPFRNLSFRYQHNESGEIKEIGDPDFFMNPVNVTIDGENRRIKYLADYYTDIRLEKCIERGCYMRIYTDVPDKELKEGDTVTLHLLIDGNDIKEKDIPEYVEKVYGIRLKKATKDITVHFEEAEIQKIDPFEGGWIDFRKEDGKITYTDSFDDCVGDTVAHKNKIELSYDISLEEGKSLDELYIGDKLKVTAVMTTFTGDTYKGDDINKYLGDNWVNTRLSETEKIYEVFPVSLRGRYSTNVNISLNRADDWKELVSDKKKFDKYDFSHIDGSTATIPITAELLRQFCGIEDDKLEYYIDHNTTGPAYEKLILGEDGKNIILVTEPSSEELTLAKEHHVELDVTPVALDGFVFITHKDNPVNSLTVEQIQRIYSGEITNWKEVGGKDEPITAYQREANSGSQTAMENLVMNGKELMEAPKNNIPITMGELVDSVASYKNATGSIGYSFYYYLNNLYKNADIKVLKINGVSPDNKNLLDKSYPFSSGYYAVTVRGADKKAEEIKEYLISDEGQELVKLAGYCPIR
ncbi:MAG: substrate-binding domain-containing protein [Ruminococcus sp.]|nr:substrate-binding domain-containing protein [Ruminococcus sp.]